MGLRGPHAGESEATRFERYVHVEPNTGCHLWTGLATPWGYGRFFRTGRSIQVYAHRHAYEAQCGPIPDGLTLDHLCRQPACVNPDHLEPVTMAENVRRERRVRRLATRCSKGHAYDQENTRTGSGYRCRKCKRAAEARQRRRWLAARGQ